MTSFTRIDWKVASIFLLFLLVIGLTYQNGWKEVLGWALVIAGYNFCIILLNKIMLRRRSEDNSNS